MAPNRTCSALAHCRVWAQGRRSGRGWPPSCRTRSWTRWPTNLSWSLGFKRRVAVALAALKGADVLLLDEPSASLDVASGARLQLELRRLTDQGADVLVSSHKLGFMEHLCDRLVILVQGWVADGALADLAQRYGIRQWADIRSETSATRDVWAAGSAGDRKHSDAPHQAVIHITHTGTGAGATGRRYLAPLPPVGPKAQ